jgi:uncharacterized sulfatase
MGVRARLALLAVGLAACGPAPEPGAPDILLISLDSVRADTLTFLDEETAPNLARLARRGTRFTQAISGTSWTLPTHAQMFTGMPPALHGLQESDLVLDPLLATLPEELREGGYRTAGFYTCWYLTDAYGFGRGFDLYENAMQGGDDLVRSLEQALEEGGAPEDQRRAFRRQVPAQRDITSPRVVERARAALERMGDEDPVFLFAHFFDPHFDYVPPPPHDTRFDPDYAGSMTGEDFWTNPEIFDASRTPPRVVSDRDLEHLRALYRGEVAWTDAAIGELLDALEARGRLDETLIVVTADHGEEFFEHGGRGHRQTLHDEVLRVPLLVVPPRSRVPAPAPVCEAQVSLSDLLPTVLDLAGLEAPPGLYGISLRPALEGGVLPARPQVATLSLPLEGGRPGRALLEALRTPEEKLLRTWARFEGEEETRLVGVAWYDLVADPDEAQPVRGLDDPRVRRAWRRLEDEQDRVRALWQAREHTPVSELFTDLEAVVGGDLAALGYATAGGEDPSARTERSRRLGLEPLAPARLSSGRAGPAGPR